MWKKSLATKRASSYKYKNSEWYTGFTYTPLKGIGFEEGIHRRDPSSIIEYKGNNYVFYTKSSGPYFGRSHIGNKNSKLFPWDYAEIYIAKSDDGINWKEIGPALKPGDSGNYDSRTVCTPDILFHENLFFLVYQTQSDDEIYTGRSENVGLAISESPEGPWEKLSVPILKPMNSGEWFDEQNCYNSGSFTGVTHDPSLYYFKNKFWLYFKCGYGNQDLEKGRSHKYAGPDTRWGVAFSHKAEGPYKHSEFNPVTNSGHETMLWHFNGGLAALLNRDGPEKETIQWSEDGINFEIMSYVTNSPQAGGAFRGNKNNTHPLEGIRWGLCHVDERNSLWNYILRFDSDPRFSYMLGHSYHEANTSSIF